MNTQECSFDELLAEVDDAQASFAESKALVTHKRHWQVCWNWAGPEVGGFCEVNTPIVDTDDGKQLYAYMERCRLLELRPDGRWLVEIAMGEVHGEPWYKDGTRLLLRVLDIWPPTRDLAAIRDSQETDEGGEDDDRANA